MKDEFGDIIAFRDALVSILEDIQLAAQCIIPMNDGDKSVINMGIESLGDYINSLKQAETPKEINKYIDVQEYLKRGADAHLSLQSTDEEYHRFVSSIMNEADYE